MNESIKAIIFDIGGVLIRTENYSGCSNWERRLGLHPGGAEAIVLNSEWGHRAQRGEITYAAFELGGQFLELGEGVTHLPARLFGVAILLTKRW